MFYVCIMIDSINSMHLLSDFPLQIRTDLSVHVNHGVYLKVDSFATDQGCTQMPKYIISFAIDKVHDTLRLSTNAEVHHTL